MNIKHEKPLKAYYPSTPRKTLQANTDETHLEEDHLILRRGVLAVYVESKYLFLIFCGRQNLFSSNFKTDHLYFKIWPI